MNPAIVLGSKEGSAAKICRLLEFFGVPSHVHKVESWNQLLSYPADGEKLKLFGSTRMILRFLEQIESKPERKQFWGTRIHSVFVYNDGLAESVAALVKILVPGRKSAVQHTPPTEFSVSELPEFCGPMSGVTCASRGAREGVCVVKSELAENIISLPEGAVFANLQHHNVPIYLSTTDVIDIDAELAARDFDIRDHFLSATPVVMYVKWAFAESCFNPPETNACLIIDDPPLKPRYGFVDFERLNDLMRCHNFSCSLAFIPWNWRRSDSRVVSLFKKNPDRLSLSVHGCDHTRSEFGIQNGDLLRWKVLCAAQRMTRHEFRTGLRHDPVMVFPQGVFSTTAMQALKGSEFIGVVNSEVISADPGNSPIKIADFWNVGLMNYDSFPIFTRRDPWQGVENFAFDIMLGKPCIAVVHHNDCHDNCRHVVDFIDRLNRLNARLVWRDLGTVVRRSFRQRKLSSNATQIEMFGKEILLENTSSDPKYFCVRKHESSLDQIQEIRAGVKSVAWTNAPDGVSFRIRLKPRQSEIVHIVYRAFPITGMTTENPFAGTDPIYWMKATFRRYLCELRDNYVMGKTFSHSHV